MRSFLVKVKRYGGGESVISSADKREDAEILARKWNSDYQTDNAYVEPFDPEKFDWPDVSLYNFKKK